MFCNTVFGEKEPLYDRTLTHGICDPCFEEFRLEHEKPDTVGQNAQILGLPIFNWLTGEPN